MEYMDETTGEATFVSRFGTSDEPEQPWFDQTCGRTVIIKELCHIFKSETYYKN